MYTAKGQSFESACSLEYSCLDALPRTVEIKGSQKQKQLYWIQLLFKRDECHMCLRRKIMP